MPVDTHCSLAINRSFLFGIFHSFGINAAFTLYSLHSTWHFLIGHCLVGARRPRTVLGNSRGSCLRGTPFDGMFTLISHLPGQPQTHIQPSREASSKVLIFRPNNTFVVDAQYAVALFVGGAQFGCTAYPSQSLAFIYSHHSVVATSASRTFLIRAD